MVTAEVARAILVGLMAIPGQSLGLANTSLRVAQGIGIVGAGLLAQVFAPGTIVGVLGAAGVIIAALAANAWARAQ